MTGRGERRARDPKTGRLYRVVGRVISHKPRVAIRRAGRDNLALAPASLLTSDRVNRPEFDGGSFHWEAAGRGAAAA